MAIVAFLLWLTNDWCVIIEDMNEDRIVVKVGGSCLQDAAGIKKLPEVIEKFAEGGRDIVIVISAFRDVTNLIEKWYDTSEGNHFDELEELHGRIFNELFPGDELDDFVLSFQQLKLIHETNMSRNASIALGERVAVDIVYQWLRKTGHDVAIPQHDPLVVGDPETFDEANTTQKIQEYWETKTAKIILTQGFASRDIRGNETHLGREGSDLTAGLWAVALGCELVMYKDVGGVFSDDPKFNNSARLIPEMTYDEYDFRFSNAQIVYLKVLRLAQKHEIPISIYSYVTHNLGTVIHKGEEGEQNTNEPA